MGANHSITSFLRGSFVRPVRAICCPRPCCWVLSDGVTVPAGPTGAAFRLPLSNYPGKVNVPDTGSRRATPFGGPKLWQLHRPSLAHHWLSYIAQPPSRHTGGRSGEAVRMHWNLGPLPQTRWPSSPTLFSPPQNRRVAATWPPLAAAQPPYNLRPQRLSASATRDFPRDVNRCGLRLGTAGRSRKSRSKPPPVSVPQLGPPQDFLWTFSPLPPEVRQTPPGDFRPPS
jgi:hypothetical protein